VILDVRKALARHEYDKALVLLNRSIEEDPDDPDLLWELAIVYDRYLEYAEKAQSIYEKFARRFPDDPRTETVQEGEDEPELLAGVDRRRKPQEALDEWAQGLRFHQAGDIDEAVKQYKKALALDSQCFNAAYNLGLAYRHRNTGWQARP
jgi:tetratricopeptide (TPR) repeat protein